jgi:hypothetical protein
MKGPWPNPGDPQPPPLSPSMECQRSPLRSINGRQTSLSSLLLLYLLYAFTAVRSAARGPHPTSHPRPSFNGAPINAWRPPCSSG